MNKKNYMLNFKIPFFEENNQPDYIKWKKKNPYYKKKFSILGDSISTLEGYNPIDYNVFYQGENSQKTGVKEIQHTWWGKVIDFFGGELLVNNSWSGSQVTEVIGNSMLFPSGCSWERISELHIKSTQPDVIIVYMGMRDWENSVRLDTDETRLLDEFYMEVFTDAYGWMIQQLKENYPKAEIWCCNLCTTFISTNPNFQYSFLKNGMKIEEYNEVIKSVCFAKKTKLIDLFSYNRAYDSIDGSYPTEVGMCTLANLIIREICGEQIEAWLFSENSTQARELNIGDEVLLKKTNRQVVILEKDYEVANMGVFDYATWSPENKYEVRCLSLANERDILKVIKRCSDIRLSNRISSFQNFMKLLYHPVLMQLRLYAENHSKIYFENFRTYLEEAMVLGAKPECIVENATTVSAVKKYAKNHVAVLNFASPTIPGGAILKGAMAQEQSLCHCSTLYPCLFREDMIKEYYEYHRNTKEMIWSDRLIYTPNVTFIKNTPEEEEILNWNNWFMADVITCTAPYNKNYKIEDKELKEIFCNRIRNILHVALKNDVRVLILGAWGCGSFGNPPELVAKAFYDVIYENGDFYKMKIVFAIPCFCKKDEKIFEIFQRIFSIKKFSDGL